MIATPLKRLIAPTKKFPSDRGNSVYKKAANSTPAMPKPRTGCKKPAAPLSESPPVWAAPPDAEVLCALSSPVGVDSSEPDEAVDPPDVAVRVPAGTVLLPPVVPFPLLLPPGTIAPPVGEAEPALPATTEETKVVPLTSAGMP